MRKPGLGRLADMQARGVPGVAAMLMAVAACYGTLALAALLPLLGLRLTLDQTVWSGTIMLLTLLTVAAVVPGIRRHRSPAPGLAAVIGAGLIGYALLVQYHALVELAGFGALAAAAYRDASLRRGRGGTPPSDQPPASDLERS